MLSTWLCTDTTTTLLTTPLTLAVRLEVPAAAAGVQTTGAVSESQVPAHNRPAVETVTTAVLLEAKMGVSPKSGLPLLSLARIWTWRTPPRSMEIGDGE